MPGRDMTGRDLQDIFYHKFAQFTRGSQTRGLVPTSAPQVQLKIKNAQCKAMEPTQSSIQQLMLRHFRELAVANSSSFFSVPRTLFQGLYAQPLTKAITSGLQCHDDNDNRSFNALPLQDRITGQELLQLELPAPPSSVMCQQPDRDEFWSIVPGQRHLFFNPKRDEISWPGGPQSELIFFKIAHATPNRLKRPTKAVDNMRPDDIVIRLYKVLGFASDSSWAFVQPQPCQDLLCASLFSWWGDDSNGPLFVNNLLEWQVSAFAHIRPRVSTELNLFLRLYSGYSGFLKENVNVFVFTVHYHPCTSTILESRINIITSSLRQHYQTATMCSNTG